MSATWTNLLTKTGNADIGVPLTCPGDITTNLYVSGGPVLTGTSGPSGVDCNFTVKDSSFTVWDGWLAYSYPCYWFVNMVQGSWGGKDCIDCDIQLNAGNYWLLTYRGGATASGILVYGIYRKASGTTPYGTYINVGGCSPGTLTVSAS